MSRSNGIDLVKGFAIFAVVLLHTIPFQLDNPALSEDGRIVRQLLLQMSRFAVPFFLVAAGYFFSRGVSSTDELWRRWKKYMFRLLPIIIVWSLINGVLSLDWLRKLDSNGLQYLYWKLVDIPKFAWAHPELFLVRGTSGPLWFIFGLVYAFTAVSVLEWLKCPRSWILMSGLFAYIGTLVFSDYLNISGLPLVPHEYRGPFIAFAFVALGHFLAGVEWPLGRLRVSLPKLLICLGLAVLEVAVLSFGRDEGFRDAPYLLMLVPVATALFVWALSLQVSGVIGETAVVLGKRSMGIYLTHMPIIDGLASFQPVGLLYDLIFPPLILILAWMATMFGLKLPFVRRFVQ